MEYLLAPLPNLLSVSQLIVVLYLPLTSLHTVYVLDIHFDNSLFHDDVFVTEYHHIDFILWTAYHITSHVTSFNIYNVSGQCYPFLWCITSDKLCKIVNKQVLGMTFNK